MSPRSAVYVGKDSRRLQGARVYESLVQRGGCKLVCVCRRPLLLAPQYSWGMTACAFGEPGSLEYHLLYCRKGARRPDDAPVHFPDARRRSGAAAAAESPMHEHMDSEDYLLRSEL